MRTLESALKDLVNNNNGDPLKQWVNDIIRAEQSKQVDSLGADDILPLLISKLMPDFKALIVGQPTQQLIQLQEALAPYCSDNYMMTFTAEETRLLQDQQRLETELKSNPNSKLEKELKDCSGKFQTSYATRGNLFSAANLMNDEIKEKINKKLAHELLLDCDNCLTDLAADITALHQKKGLSPLFELFVRKDDTVWVSARALMDKETIHETLKSYPDTVKLINLCKQYNAVKALQDILVQPNKASTQKISAFKKRVTDIKSSKDIQPSSRLREFFRNISRTLSKFFTKKRKLPRDSIFSRKSLAEQTVDRIQVKIKGPRK